MVNTDPRELQVLSGLLAYPAEDSLDLLQEWSQEIPWLVASLSELRDLPLDAWQGEHTRLFINGIPKTICPPFESAWRNEGMRGESATRIGWIYRQAGLEHTMDMEMPDYLGAMLECTAALQRVLQTPQEQTGENTSSASATLLEELWNDHLTTWVPEFATTLVQESQVTLYRLLGKRLQALFA